MPAAPDPMQAVLDHYRSGRYAAARVLLTRILQRRPADPEANHLSALCLLAIGQSVQAEFFVARALAGAPGRADFANTMALVLSAQSKAEAALGWFARAAEAMPGDPTGHANLGHALLQAQRTREGIGAYERALAIDPEHSASVRALGLFWRLCGRTDRALPLLRRAVELDPRDAEAASNLALALNYHEGARPEEVLAAHRHAGRLLAGRAGAGAPPPEGALAARDAGRPLRIGYLSPDFRSHSVALFIEPLLRHRDRARHSAHLYMTAPKVDGVSERLRGLADAWTMVDTLTDAALAARLKADQLDVLIDLAGLTKGSRIAALAARCAPVQGTYLGYPSTTGVPGVDFRIVDAITDPPSAEVDAWHSERLVRLDRCFLAFGPPADAPQPAARPAAGPITLGSFNLFMKITPGAARVWGRILARLPNSRLLLKTIGLDSPGVREVFTAMLAENGLDVSRVDFLPFAPTKREHYETYAHVDVALDPFPYCGTATTCEALFMGVPVVTLSGRTHVQRVGESLLHAAGFSEWVARTEGEYVEKAVALATDPARLAALRGELRPRVLASALCDGAALARAFEGAVWRLASA
ncbi:MAG: tetratricopeptide repeat protein [Phycisphaerales bacterium]